MLLSTY